MPTLRPTALIVWSVAALIVWAIHLVVIYGFQGLVCTRGFETSILGIGLVPFIVGVATIVAIAAEVGLLVAAMRAMSASAVQTGHGTTARPFMHWLAAALTGFALIAIIWEAIPIFLLPPCG